MDSRQMNKYSIILVTVIVSGMIICACSHHPWGTPAKEYEFLTGECLVSPELTLAHTELDSDGYFHFGFRLDLSNVHSKESDYSPYPYYHTPDNNLFSSFGSNSKMVEEEYNAIMNKLVTWPWQSRESLFYCHNIIFWRNIIHCGQALRGTRCL